MNEFEFREFDEPYDKARQEIKKAVQDSLINAYADGYGPLMLSKIDSRRLQDEAFQAVIREEDWPSLREDSLVEPVFDYHDDQEFLTSLCPSDEEGERHLASSHFFVMLAQEPRRTPDWSASINQLYGTYPVVHRAHAVAPELFDNLQAVLSKLMERYSGVISDTDILREELERPQNEAVVRAIHMAYRIMGRLMKVEDPARIARRISPTGNSVDMPMTLLSADDFLRHGPQL